MRICICVYRKDIPVAGRIIKRQISWTIFWNENSNAKERRDFLKFLRWQTIIKLSDYSG